MEDYQKRLKTDRIKLFVRNVMEMQSHTPADGWMMGEAINQLPPLTQQFLISELPDSVLRREYQQRGLRKLPEGIEFEAPDSIEELYKTEVYEVDRLHAVARLLGLPGEFLSETEVVEEVLKLFPRRLKVEEFANEVYYNEFG